MTPLEAQSCGRPVLAYGRGGALETVKDGRTGLFFQDQTPESLIQSMEEFETRQWNPASIRKHAQTFDRDIHSQRILAALQQGWKEFRDLPSRHDPNERF